ncbi:hypothetical protein PGT21_029128 [Puccinia graminis f. sp. tritici]|uniref:Uncharacterized protein n=1 Tax=Puccinia graminis f. sp. tritici TaxID=56615 RepID=A0A5B0RQS0_PUCGR|nr:hypothetical protein PGT21_029128 [Puccinia graminis f. sp. tritici]KAA1128316.1 hypothetical protein PGTUg99_006476 [Puccinia graminis f. sp. tritici]
MKASFPSIFLIMLTTSLASRAIGLLVKERSAKVTDPLVKQWELAPHIPSRYNPPKEKILYISKDSGLAFFPYQPHWLVHNQLACPVTIKIHFKDANNQPSNVDRTIDPVSSSDLTLNSSEGLTIDVLSVGELQ